MYHGGDNRFKSGHAEGCPIRSYDGFVLEVLDGSLPDDVRCNCSPKENA